MREHQARNDLLLDGLKQCGHVTPYPFVFLPSQLSGMPLAVAPPDLGRERMLFITIIRRLVLTERTHVSFPRLPQ